MTLDDIELYAIPVRRILSQEVLKLYASPWKLPPIIWRTAPKTSQYRHLKTFW